MAKVKTEDLSMSRVRDWVEANKPTLQELGILMGCDESTARQSAFQFLKSRDPHISTLRRFAKAAGISIEDLVSEAPLKKK